MSFEELLKWKGKLFFSYVNFQQPGELQNLHKENSFSAWSKTVQLCNQKSRFRFTTYKNIYFGISNLKQYQNYGLKITKANKR